MIIAARAAVALTLTIGIAAGCTPTTPSPISASPSAPLASPSPSGSPSIAPSVSPSEPPSPSPSAAAAQPCASADLTVTAGEWGGAAGSRGTDVTVQSNAASACELPASPAVVALDAGGAVVAQGRKGAVGTGPMIEPGATARFSLQFSNWCEQNVRLPLHFALLLVSGSTEIGKLALASPDDLPPCNGPGQPVSLSTTDWEL